MDEYEKGLERLLQKPVADMTGEELTRLITLTLMGGIRHRDIEERNNHWQRPPFFIVEDAVRDEEEA